MRIRKQQNEYVALGDKYGSSCSQFSSRHSTRSVCLYTRYQFLMKALISRASIITFTINILVQVANAQGTTSRAPTTAGRQDDGLSIVQRDADSRTWQRTTYEYGPSGELLPQVHQYTELATGMHYKNPQTGEWVESNEQIEIRPNGGAQAVHGQHQVYFPADIYDGVIEVVTSDGKHLKSRPLGISYDDGKSSVLIAELQHSIGQLLASGNQVIYTNAFTDFNADLVCTYKKSGFECDLILREQPTTPELFGLKTSQSQIQLLTEFFDAPEPEQLATPTAFALVSQSVSMGVSAQDLPDASLKFGAMTMVRGKAFALDEETRAGHPTVGIPVSKTWAKIENRTVLVESVPLAKVEAQMPNLPKRQQPFAQANNVGSVRYRVSNSPLLPPARIASVGTKVQRFAQGKSPDTKGFVLDYNLVNPSLTDFTFKGGATYLVTGLISLSGTTTIEGGCVIKFVQTNSCFLQVAGAVNCATSPYRPAVFTSVDDNTVGETISGSSGNPVIDSANWYLYMWTGTFQINLHDLRFAYCYVGIAKVNEPGVDMRDIQFVHTAWPVYLFSFVTNASQSTLRNVLMTDVTGAAISLGNIDLDIENLTVDRCAQLGYHDYTANLHFTNSLIVGVLSMGDTPYTTNNSAVLSTNTGVFQTVGAGSYYLANNSIYRDVGTTNINTALLADIRQKTTYPPVLYTNVTVSTNTVLNLQVQRDIDMPDIGYHYDPIDYLVDSFMITNATITVFPGTAVASYGDSGLVPSAGSTLSSIGTVLAPIWYTKHFCVQEEPMIRGVSPNSSVIVNPYHLSAPPVGLYRFSKFSTVGSMGYLLYHSQNTWSYSNLLVEDCEFWGGLNDFSGYNNANANFKNNLFARSVVAATASGMTNDSLVFSNNLFWNGVFTALPFSNSNSWIFFNNSFDHSTNNVAFASPNFVNGYNAYIGDTNVTKRLMPIGTHDILVATNVAYQSGPLGGFYLSATSPLINSGSVTADLASLYHYTTTTNQLKETNSTVDIGYHYVALDALGNPIDTDGDGIPDYLEDANGNGLVDGSESSWLLNSYNGLSFGSGLQVFTPLK